AKITYENVSNDTYKPGQTAQRLIEKSIQTTEDYAHGNSDSSLEDPVLQPFDSGDQALIHTTNALWLGSGLLHAANNKILNTAGNKITGETAQGVDQGVANFANYEKGHVAPAPKADTPALTPPAPAPSPQQAPTLAPKPVQVQAPAPAPTPKNPAPVPTPSPQQAPAPAPNTMINPNQAAQATQNALEAQTGSILTNIGNTIKSGYEKIKTTGNKFLDTAGEKITGEAAQGGEQGFTNFANYGKGHPARSSAQVAKEAPAAQPNIDTAQAAQNALRQLEIKTLKAQQEKEFLTAFNKLSNTEKANFSTADADKIFNKNKNMIEINKRLEEVLDPTRVYTAPVPKAIPGPAQNPASIDIPAPIPAQKPTPANNIEPTAVKNFIEAPAPAGPSLPEDIKNAFNNFKNFLKHEYDSIKITGAKVNPTTEAVGNTSIIPAVDKQKAVIPLETQQNAIAPFNAQTKALATLNNEIKSIARFNPEQKAIAPFVEQPKAMTPFNDQTKAMTPFNAQTKALATLNNEIKAIAPVVAEQKSMTPFKIAQTDIVPVLTKENAVIPFKLEQKDILPAIAKENAITPYKSEQKDIIPFVEQQKNLATKLSQDVQILEQELAKTLPAIRSNAAPVAKPVQASTQQIPQERPSRIGAQYEYLPEDYIQPGNNVAIAPVKPKSPNWEEYYSNLL
ncbi:MAG: hypothetical protein Q8Q69_00915, partial [Nitrosopumilaceae archaeon]|nr:hypothetical protein [Nitrosopumilaceae archaeon]